MTYAFTVLIKTSKRQNSCSVIGCYSIWLQLLKVNINRS